MSPTLRYSVLTVMLLSTTALSIFAYQAMKPELPAPPEPTIAQSEPEPAKILCSHMMSDEAIAAFKQKSRDSRIRSDESVVDFRTRSRDEPDYGPNWQPPTFCGTREQLEALAARLDPEYWETRRKEHEEKTRVPVKQRDDIRTAGRR